MTARERPVLRPRCGSPVPVPYVLTPAAYAALATDPANDLRHEPRGGRLPCDGRDCACRFPGPRRSGAT